MASGSGCASRRAGRSAAGEASGGGTLTAEGEAGGHAPGDGRVGRAGLEGIGSKLQRHSAGIAAGAHARQQAVERQPAFFRPAMLTAVEVAEMDVAYAVGQLFIRVLAE